MTEIEKALEKFRGVVVNRVLCPGPGVACHARHADEERTQRLALLAAITRREAEVRAEALEEAGREFATPQRFNVMFSGHDVAQTLLTMGGGIRALTKEQP